MRLLSMRLLSFMLAVPVAIALATAACSSDSAAGAPDCSAKSKCSAQPAKSAEDLKTCNADQASSRCGGAYNQLLSCLQKNEKCTADNRTDLAVSDSACGALRQSWQDCLQLPPADAGGGG